MATGDQPPVPTGGPCATICMGDGPNCGAECVRRCAALEALLPRCTAQIRALLQCSADNGFRCPPPMMQSDPPAACAAQEQAAMTCSDMD